MQTKNTGKNLKIHNDRNSGNNLAHNERCGPGLQQEAPSPTISVHRRADDQLLGQGKDGDDHDGDNDIGGDDEDDSGHDGSPIIGWH